MKSIEKIKKIINESSTSSGIYKMINKKGQILYVGKAKNIQKRLKSYLNLNNHSSRIKRLINSIQRIELIITETEKEALLLEANLIKKLKPQYNILLRDDKSFPYIFINHEQLYPQICKHRGKQRLKGKYYGPFATVNSLNQTLKILQKIFLLRSCESSIFENRSKPCLLYQIERCSAPCVNIINKEEYLKSVNDAQNFLSGKHSNLQKNLSKKMEEESQKENYEKAASYRDKIEALTQIQSQQNINLQNIKNTDVISISRQGSKSCIQVFIYRSGQNWGNRSYFPKHSEDVDTAEIIERFIIDFYTKYTPPKQILINHRLNDTKLVVSSLKSLYRFKTILMLPKQGKKHELIKYATKNSDLSLNNYISLSLNNNQILKSLSKSLNLKKEIKRVEAYDNSHLFGKNAVGAMVVFNKNGFDKTSYRKFNINYKDITPGDDYGMMENVLNRRFDKEAIRNKNKYSNLPDAILIDGGKSHYKVAKKILGEKRLLHIELISIFKGSGRKNSLDRVIYKDRVDYIKNDIEPFYFLQRLRDESHRFALGAHKTKNRRDIKNSELEPISGLGKNRRKMLLNHFGSMSNIKTASATDLAKVNGISKLLSEKIYDYFND